MCLFCQERFRLKCQCSFHITQKRVCSSFRIKLWQSVCFFLEMSPGKYMLNVKRAKCLHSSTLAQNYFHIHLSFHSEYIFIAESGHVSKSSFVKLLVVVEWRTDTHFKRLIHLLPKQINFFKHGLTYKIDTKINCASTKLQ